MNNASPAPTQSETLLAALLRGDRVDRVYAITRLGIAHPGARIAELRHDWYWHQFNDGAFGSPMTPPETVFQCVETRVGRKRRSYYHIPEQYRESVKKWRGR